MLPLFLTAWETDATLRAAVQAGVQSAIPTTGATALGGGELSADARATGPRSLYTIEARGRVDRTLVLGAPDPPETSVDVDVAGTATWMTSPLSTLALTALGSLATTSGVRADSLLLALDPFEEGRRLEYALGADLAYTLTTGPRTELGLDGGVSQAGALDAESKSAIGLDSREAHGGITYDIDVAKRLSITPELRFTTTRFEHALLDVDHRRGRADIHTGSLILGGKREIAPQLFFTASAGITLGTPMPIAQASGPVVAPEAGLGLRWRGRRAELRARYSWSYSSLGPRIGYGQTHAATLRLTAWPFASPELRQSLMRVTVRAGHGSAPIAADPPLAVPGMPPPSLSGTLVVTTLATRATFEIPITRGWAALTGIDLLAARGRTDAGDARSTVIATFTLGLAATVSTDPRRLYPRAPGADEDEATRRASVNADRAEDRSVIDQGRDD